MAQVRRSRWLGAAPMRLSRRLWGGPSQLAGELWRGEGDASSGSEEGSPRGAQLAADRLLPGILGDEADATGHGRPVAAAASGAQTAASGAQTAASGAHTAASGTSGSASGPPPRAASGASGSASTVPTRSATRSPRPRPGSRSELLWAGALRNAEQLLDEASREKGILVLMPAVGVAAVELEARVRQLAARPGRGRSYVGSTADPTWRWRGGPVWRSEAGGREPAARPGTMVGHRRHWRRLVVLGSWRDRQAATMEARAIQAAREAAGHRVDNVASDARGLAVRPHGYSFVYICID